MIEINYTYNSVEKIFNDVILIKDFDLIWYSILISFLIFFFISVTYILPTLYIFKEEYIKNREKKSKKLLLKQIVMQKELEDEILKEVKKH